MPGITGIICKHRSDKTAQDVRLMAGVMKHESFYSTGEYINDDLGIHVAWTGHQTVASSHLPITNATKDVILIFAGENYQRRQMPAELKQADTTRDNSGLACLLKLYSDDEIEFLRQLNGWFCGIVADLRRRKLTLFNDRYGMGRLYYYEGEDEFLFSSEAKSILKVRPELRRINPASLAQYLRTNCVMDNRTLFDKIGLLPQAAAWLFQDGCLSKKQRYFSFRDWEELPKANADDFYSRFSEIVSNVFPKYAESPDNVAMSMTAGLDTRVIMAAIQARGRSLPCYTFGGTWGETFDIRTARTVANVLGQSHQAIRIGDDFLKNFGFFARRTIYISDGTHDSIGAHDLYFNQIARKIAPIRLTGKFGSEVVRIRRMIPWQEFPQNLLLPEFKPFFDNAPSLEQVSASKNILTRAVSEEIPWFEFGRDAIEQSQIVLRTPYMDNELVRLMFQAPDGLRAAGTLQAAYVREKSPELSEILTNLSRSGNHNRLTKELIYFSFWSLFKAEYIYLYATPHWLTRIDHWLRCLKLERLFAGRQKFEAYRIWMTTHFSDFIRDTLSNSNVQYTNFFEPKIAKKMVQRHLAGTHNHMNELNKLLTVELIYSTLLGDQN